MQHIRRYILLFSLCLIVFPTVFIVPSAQASTGLTIYQSYNDIHSPLGQVGIDTPMRYGTAATYGYNHIVARAQQDPATHVGEPALSFIIQNVLTNGAAAVVDTDDGYNVTARFIGGDIWTVVVSERPINDSGQILGIITVFKVDACRSC